MAASFIPLPVAVASPQSSLQFPVATPKLRSSSRLPSCLPARVTAQASADSQISPVSNAFDLLKGVAAAAIVLSASATLVDPAAAGTLKASAVLRGAPGVEGTVTIEQDGDGPSVLSVEVSGLAPGKLVVCHTNTDAYKQAANTRQKCAIAAVHPIRPISRTQAQLYQIPRIGTRLLHPQR